MRFWQPLLADRSNLRLVTLKFNPTLFITGLLLILFFLFFCFFFVCVVIALDISREVFANAVIFTNKYACNKRARLTMD